MKSCIVVAGVLSLLVGLPSVGAESPDEERGAGVQAYSVPTYPSATLERSEGLSLSGTPVGSGLPRRPGVSVGRLSLLDPSKIRMAHGLSLGFVGGSGQRGRFESRYLNRIFYPFTPSLSLRLDLDYVVEPFGSASQSEILPGMVLRYEPSDHLLLQVQYRTYRNMRSSSWWASDLSSDQSPRW
ncbi:hypothetical protein AMJ82_11145 [candidate division TA06 bacterium SM23_40]|uniref:MipA/OmpV family protein n=1 Tax=candidate division TA06 bacterium SM23_40 TaxID=1703774 RepID=A0A0S8G2K3_UNCT6|nr:MAG: hypothetical protein AMJ82_11145 [candidate division TA06 bacterium SM23_40]